MDYISTLLVSNRTKTHAKYCSKCQIFVEVSSFQKEEYDTVNNTIGITLNDIKKEFKWNSRYLARSEKVMVYKSLFI